MNIRCAVIGNPIAHSRSPQIHAGFAQEYGIDLQYERILAQPAEFENVVKRFFALGGRGLNVTLPFKESAYQLAKYLTPYAKNAGAVNTLWQIGGELYGDNTDGRGLCLALEKEHGLALAGKKVLLLGAGGAARGVIFPLLEKRVANIDILNRTRSKAETLASQYDARVFALDNQPAHSYDIIINATSAGLSDDAFSLDAVVLHQDSVCYDMVYGRKTAFMSWAESNACQYVFDGQSMLEQQARLSFFTWFAKEIGKEDAVK